MIKDEADSQEFRRAMEDKVRRRREDKEAGYTEIKALALPDKEYVEDDEDTPDRRHAQLPGLLEAMKQLTYHMSRKMEKGQEPGHGGDK